MSSPGPQLAICPRKLICLTLVACYKLQVESRIDLDTRLLAQMAETVKVKDIMNYEREKICLFMNISV